LHDKQKWGLSENAKYDKIKKLSPEREWHMCDDAGMSAFSKTISVLKVWKSGHSARAKK